MIKKVLSLFALAVGLYAQPQIFTIDAIIQSQVSSLQALAQIHNATNEYNFNIAVANAKSNNAVPPTSYQIEVIHPDAVDKTLRGQPPYDTSGWITLQTFTPEVVTPTPKPVPVVPVGPDSGNGIVFLDTGAPGYSDGAIWQDSRGVFQKHITITPFGKSIYWLKVPEAKSF